MTLAAQTRLPASPVPPAGDDPEAGPLRRCLASGESGPKERMVRFVVSPAGEVVPDVAGRLPGRGFWLRAESAMMKDPSGLARLFGRAARRPVDVPADLAERIERLLAGRCLERIGLARRAGQALAGADKVALALSRGLGRGGVLLEAADAGSDGQEKMARLASCEGTTIGVTGATVVRVLTADELGAAFGRARVAHALVTAGGLAEALRCDAARLEDMRGSGGLAEATNKPDDHERID